MKIVLGHDYYDGAGMGVDEDIVFVRKEEETWNTPFNLEHRDCRSFYNGIKFTFHYVLVAGKVYPAMKETHPSKLNGHIYTSDIHWHYALESAVKALKNSQESSNKWDFLARNIQFDIDMLEQHFRKTEDPLWTDWMLSNRVVTGFVSRKERSYKDVGTFARLNISDLKDIEFYRVLDPATIHMEISNYIGGVLPRSTKTVEINDLDRIRKAGFDTRKSFRQAAGVKKPRRRK